MHVTNFSQHIAIMLIFSLQKYITSYLPYHAAI